MILVTGGTGMVGAHLLFHLAQKETAIKCIYRNPETQSKVKKIFSYYTEKPETLFTKIEWIKADLNDIPALETAFINVSRVYHCAALISFDPKNYYELRKINVKGTANIVNLCIAHGVKKLCHVSSIGAIGKGLDTNIYTEETDWNEAKANVYGLSKYSAEMEVWRGAQEGLEVIIVNPGIIVGPGFWNTGSGKLFSTAAKGGSLYPPGGTGFISVNDVVKMMLTLMESSVSNERFIAVSENLTYKEVLSSIAEKLEVSKPRKVLKFWQLQILWRLDWFRNLFSKKDRLLTKNRVKALRQRDYFNNKKIGNFIPYEYQNLDTAITFCAKEYLKDTL